MNEQAVLQLAAGAMMLAAKIGGPIVLAAMGVGLVISLFQSVTQIQESTLTFVPKVIAVGLVLVVAGHWMIGTYVTYTHNLFAMVPQLISGG